MDKQLNRQIDSMNKISLHCCFSANFLCSNGCVSEETLSISLFPSYPFSIILTVVDLLQSRLISELLDSSPSLLILRAIINFHVTFVVAIKVVLYIHMWSRAIGKGISLPQTVINMQVWSTQPQIVEQKETTIYCLW